MSPEKREAVVAYFRDKGMSEAELAYRFRDDKPQWPEPTIAGMHDEAAKWPGRIKSFEVTTLANGDVNVKLARVGSDGPWEVTLVLDGATSEKAGTILRNFCMMQITAIEKLGNPRWDALVAEESAR